MKIEIYCILNNYRNHSNKRPIATLAYQAEIHILSYQLLQGALARAATVYIESKYCTYCTCTCTVLYIHISALNVLNDILLNFVPANQFDLSWLEMFVDKRFRNCCSQNSTTNIEEAGTGMWAKIGENKK